MSTDPRLDLAELVADVRALLEDAALRGVRSDPPGEAIPEPLPLDPVVAASPTSRWAAIAEADRRTVASPLDALRKVRDDLGDCRRCALCQGRRNIVFGAGDPTADLLVIGEGPGPQEDSAGQPFLGPAGEMLDKMLENVLGLQRSEVYMCDVVMCRPPQARSPLPDEVAACRPFLERQVEAVAPKLILVLGAVAFGSLFGGEEGARGVWRTWRDIPVLPTFHPAYLLENPDDKRLAFADLKSARARYDELGGKRF